MSNRVTFECEVDVDDALWKDFATLCDAGGEQAFAVIERHVNAMIEVIIREALGQFEDSEYQIADAPVVLHSHDDLYSGPEQLIHGDALGIALRRRNKDDPHMLVTPCVEDGGQWMLLPATYSSHWLDEMLACLDVARSWMQQHGRQTQEGYEFLETPGVES